MSRRGWEVCHEALGVSLSKTAPGADLGGSSKYSNESFEDSSGEGFHVSGSSYSFAAVVTVLDSKE